MKLTHPDPDLPVELRQINARGQDLLIERFDSMDECLRLLRERRDRGKAIGDCYRDRVPAKPATGMELVTFAAEHAARAARLADIGLERTLEIRRSVEMAERAAAVWAKAAFISFAVVIGLLARILMVIT